MAWSYDERNLNTTDALGRLNATRFLIGDTNEDDQQVQDEEVAFALAQANNNTYFAGAFLCRTIAAKYAALGLDIFSESNLAYIVCVIM